MNNKVIAICAILKDEHQYLKEWIEYHLSIGVTCIYLYEDVTSITHIDIVKNYNNVYLASISDFIDIDNCLEKQRDVYNKFILTYRETIDYAFFIDLDEYVTFGDGYCIDDLTNICDEMGGGLLLPWKHFGANEYIDNPHLPVLDTYKKEVYIKFPKNPNGCKLLSKSFANIKEGRMKHIHIHSNAKPIVPYDSENLYQMCWINHYITKSWEEWCNRIFVRGQNESLIRRIDEFFIYNPEMLPIKEELYNKSYFKSHYNNITIKPR